MKTLVPSSGISSPVTLCQMKTLVPLSGISSPVTQLSDEDPGALGITLPELARGTPLLFAKNAVEVRDVVEAA